MTYLSKMYTITLDDDPMVHKMVARSTGMTSLPYTSTSTLLGRLDRFAPVALFVDVNLGPGDCGLDAVPTFRKAWPFTPILVITADEADEAVGNALASGANDFIRKPIHHAELAARLKARISEMKVLAGRDLVSHGPLTYSRMFHSVSCEDRIIYLSPSEALLLESLLDAKGMIVPKAELKRRVWGDLKVSNNALDKKIFDLRSNLRTLSDAIAVTTAYRAGVSLSVTVASNIAKAS